MPKPKRDGVTVKIDPEVYHQAKRITAFRDIKISEYISDLLRKPVARDYEKLREEYPELGPSDKNQD
jgi:hypothetical protein